MKINIRSLTVTENLYPDPAGFLLKVFLACSRADTKVFKVNGEQIKLNQSLNIKNLVAKELEFWLCTTYDKIIVLFLSCRQSAHYRFPKKEVNAILS